MLQQDSGELVVRTIVLQRVQQQFVPKRFRKRGHLRMPVKVKQYNHSLKVLFQKLFYSTKIMSMKF